MNKKNYCKNKLVSTKAMKRYLILLSIVVIISALVISYSLVFTTSSGQLTKTAGSETQFEVDLAYAYAGKWTANTSYTDSDGHQMSLVSRYPCVVMLNVTRLPGVKISSCDAIIEVYGVHVATNTGQFEKFAYGIGTNYTCSFSPSKIRSFISHLDDIVDKTVYRGGYEGTMSLNWTDNKSIMTNPFGSACIYSSYNTTLGLWKTGTPTTISVTVNRIGYLTMSNDTVTIYKDTETNTKISAQLSNYDVGFLYNSIVPVAQLPQTNLFVPTATKQPSS